VETAFGLHLLLRAWLLVPGGPLLAALVGLALARRRPVAGTVLAGGAIGFLIALSLPLVADPLTASLDRYPPLAPAAAAGAGAIVVLSGATLPSPDGVDRPSSGTLERLAEGARLARATGIPLLLTGGPVTAREPAAVAMERSLETSFGLRARWLESASRTTRENARESARVLRAEGIRRVVVVTSEIHLPRAVGEFEAEGLEVLPAPAGSVASRPGGLGDWLPGPGALQRSADALYERAGLLLAARR
jgi:uncharacterized SAM-binding protein YcdF (DUF218 family)